MTSTDFSQAADHRRHHRATVWRILVGMQLTVIALILASLLIVFLIGLLSSLFVQRSL